MDRERFDRRGNLVDYGSDRPPVVEQTIRGGFGEGVDRLEVRIVVPLTQPRVVRGHTIGGGMSREAIRRARRHLSRFR